MNITPVSRNELKFGSLRYIFAWKIETKQIENRLNMNFARTTCDKKKFVPVLYKNIEENAKNIKVHTSD